MLKGYKTYIVGFIAIIGAVAEFLIGNLPLADALQIVTTGLIGLTLRSGIKNSMGE